MVDLGLLPPFAPPAAILWRRAWRPEQTSDPLGERKGGSHGRQTDRRRAGGVSISFVDQTAAAWTLGAESGSADRLSGFETAHLCRAVRPDQPFGQHPQAARRS